MDSVDWEAVRSAKFSQVANTIASRGQHNIIAARIQNNNIFCTSVGILHNCFMKFQAGSYLTIILEYHRMKLKIYLRVGQHHLECHGRFASMLREDMPYAFTSTVEL